jgi:hypothetical protein
MDSAREASLPGKARFVALDTVSRLADQDMRSAPARRQFGRQQMSVRFPTKVAREQDRDAANIDPEHGRSQDVPCVVRRELDSVHGDLLVVVYRCDLVIALEQTLLRKQLVFGRHVTEGLRKRRK